MDRIRSEIKNRRRVELGDRLSLLFEIRILCYTKFKRRRI